MDYDVFLNEEVDFNNDKFRLFVRRDPVAKIFDNILVGQRKGFLGLSVDAIKAIWLAKCLKKHGVDVYVTHSELRNEIDEVLLLKVAEDSFLEKIKSFPGYDFSATERVLLNGAPSIRTIGFYKRSEKMASEGFAPPGIFLYVDKYDSHVLTTDELLNMEVLDNLIDS